MRVTGHLARAFRSIGVAAMVSATAVAQASPGQSGRCESIYHPYFQRLVHGQARSLCGVDTRPTPHAEVVPARLPHWSGEFEESMYLVVNADGTVDSTSLEPMGSTMTMLAERSPFAVPEELRAEVRAMTYSPAMLRGTPVRTGFHLVLVASAAPDSVPAVASWRYVVGERSDTMRLEWKPGAPLTVPNARTAAAVLLVADAELRMSKMDGRNRPRGWNGCSELAGSLPFVVALREHLRGSGTPIAGDADCPSGDDPNRVGWTGLFRVSDTMYLVRFSYPVGADAWATGRCWVERRDRGWRAGCG